MANQLEGCSGDTEQFTSCSNPANWNLLPYEGASEDLRSPFCNDCAQFLGENCPDANPGGFQMTVRQAHLWIAQGRDCICSHPGNNCEAPASVVVKAGLEVLAICTQCVECGNGFMEGFQDIIAAFYLDKAK